MLVFVCDVEDEARSGGKGRKLQDPDDRWETKVKISVIRRCWIVVSYVGVSVSLMFLVHGGVGGWLPVVCRTWSDVVDRCY